MSYWIRRHLQLKLVRKLELRFCMARTATALAIFHDGHHRDPGSLARWSIMMSSRLVQVRALDPAAEVSPSPAQRRLDFVSSRLEK